MSGTQNATDGVYCYRVPSSVRSPSSGDLLVFAEARRGSCGDQAPKDIVVSRSSDNGATWSAPVSVVGQGIANQTYRNPYAVFTGGEQLLLQFVNTTSDAWESFQIVSGDDGKSWTQPASIAADLGAWNGVLAGPGAGILLGQSSPHSVYAGRLVACGTMGYWPGHAMNATVWYSDTNGAYWNVSVTPFPLMAECQVAELSSGNLVINFRADHINTCNCRAQSISMDGGASWGPLTFVPALVEPVCSAGLLKSSAGLWFSNPASETQRVNMTVRLSTDGTSWPASQSTLVWDGPAAYSVLVPLDDGFPGTTVGLVFERGLQGPYEQLSFAAVPAPLS